MPLFREHTDVSVRPALPDDAVAIAATQLRAWRTDLADVIGTDILDRIDAQAVRARWSQAIEQPPSPAHRVLVACDGPRVVGMAASVPTACDNVPDATAIEVTALEVDPDHRRSGHGSRLLAACVDLGRQDGAVEVQCWVPDSAEARAWFLGASGMAADGATRQLVGPDGNNLGESRWTATL